MSWRRSAWRTSNWTSEPSYRGALEIELRSDRTRVAAVESHQTVPVPDRPLARQLLESIYSLSLRQEHRKP